MEVTVKVDSVLFSAFKERGARVFVKLYLSGLSQSNASPLFAVVSLSKPELEPVYFSDKSLALSASPHASDTTTFTLNGTKKIHLGPHSNGRFVCVDLYAIEDDPRNEVPGVEFTRKYGGCTLFRDGAFDLYEYAEVASAPTDVRRCGVVTARRTPFPSFGTSHLVTKAEEFSLDVIARLKREFPLDVRFSFEAQRDHYYTPLRIGTRVSSQGLGTIYPALFIENPVAISERWFEYFYRVVRRRECESFSALVFTPEIAFRVCCAWVQSHHYVSDAFRFRSDPRTKSAEVCGGNSYTSDFSQTATNCKDKAVTIMHIVTCLMRTIWREGSVARGLSEAIQRYVPYLATGILLRTEAHMFVSCIHEDPASVPSEERVFVLEGTTTYDPVQRDVVYRPLEWYETMRKFIRAKARSPVPDAYKTTKYQTRRFEVRETGRATDLMREFAGCGSGGYRPYDCITSLHTWWFHERRERKHEYSYWVLPTCSECRGAKHVYGVTFEDFLEGRYVMQLRNPSSLAPTEVYERARLLYAFEQPSPRIDVDFEEHPLPDAEWTDLPSGRSPKFHFFVQRSFEGELEEFVRERMGHKGEYRVEDEKGGCKIVYLF